MRFSVSHLASSVVLGALAFAACGDDNAAGPPTKESPDGGSGEGGPHADGGGEPFTPGERFDLDGKKFTVPTGGLAITGFSGLAQQDGFENERDEYWVTEDMTGDGIPDLVLTTVIREVQGTESEDDIYDETFGYPSTPHWRVYPGSAEGFATKAIEWGLPSNGGRIARGYYRARNQGGAERPKNDRNLMNKQGDEAWTLQDMDGDSKPDLVVTGAAAELVMIGYVFRVFGYPSTPSWKVYRNTGNGFDKTPLTWSVPKTHEWDNHGGLATASSATMAQHKTHLWELRDIDGDKRPDLLVYAAVEPAGGSAFRARPAGQPASPHWDVYLNDGKGFAATPTSWSLPKQRGRGDDGLNAPGGAGNEDGDNTWSLVDMDGDDKPELVVSAVQIAGTMKSPGYPSDSHWEVYKNDGSRFDPNFLKWKLPRGGTGNGGFKTTGFAQANVPGDHAWSTVDIDGDKKPDLVITGEFKAAGANPALYNLGRASNEPHWMIHLNGGQGFAEDGKRWDLPKDGGLRELGFTTVSGGGTKIADERWALFDLTGDRQPELVRLGTSVQDPRNPENPDFTIVQVNGHGSSPHWLVHRNVP